jgi:sterol 14-demethylase
MMDINAIDSTHTIIAGAVLLVATLYFLVFSGKRRSSNAPPFANVGIPLLGNYIEFAKNPIAFQHMCRKSVGDVFTVAMLHKKLTFLLSPEASKCFYEEKDDAMSQSEVYGFMTAVFGKDVVYDAEPKKRIQQMQHMATNLQSRRLAAYVPKIEKEVVDYIARWKNEGETDILNDLSELTILTASRCLHGDDVREELFEDVARIYHDLDKVHTPTSSLRACPSPPPYPSF